MKSRLYCEHYPKEEEKEAAINVNDVNKKEAIGGFEFRF